MVTSHNPVYLMDWLLDIFCPVIGGTDVPKGLALPNQVDHAQYESQKSRNELVSGGAYGSADSLC
jgi:hypothetical protein